MKEPQKISLLQLMNHPPCSHFTFWSPHLHIFAETSIQYFYDPSISTFSRNGILNDIRRKHFETVMIVYLLMGNKVIWKFQVPNTRQQAKYYHTHHIILRSWSLTRSCCLGRRELMFSSQTATTSYLQLAHSYMYYKHLSLSQTTKTKHNKTNTVSFW